MRKAFCIKLTVERFKMKQCLKNGEVLPLVEIVDHYAVAVSELSQIIVGAVQSLDCPSLF